MFRWLAIALVILASAATAPAQLSVRLRLDRDRYLLYEGITATVQVDNFGAGPVKLEDAESAPWLRLQVFSKGGQPISIVGSGFLAGSTTLKPGEAIARSANLVAFYRIREVGEYRVRAIVKAAGLGGAFQSNDLVFTVVGGRTLWSKSLGVAQEKDKNTWRTFALVNLRLDPYDRLYARIENEREDLVYGVIPLGPSVTLGAPRAEVDRNARLHILHQTAPRHFNYTVISMNGIVLKRDAFSDFESRPELRRGEDGELKVIGGEKIAASPSVVPLYKKPEPPQ
ncbi:MAG: hypothetical protein HZA91_11980 [Verrucomicrobia bacterium]|nr:hypothetical protein [Verrucomicrobiota bacterium]